MYTGKKGLYVLKDHVERIQSNGKDPWSFFNDYSLIEELFGKLAVEWAKNKKKEQLTDFLKRLENTAQFKETIAQKEEDHSDIELINLDQAVVLEELGYALDSSGKHITELPETDVLPTI